MLKKYRSAILVIAILSFALMAISLASAGVYTLLAGGDAMIAVSNGLFIAGALVLIFGSILEYFKLEGMNKWLAGRFSTLPLFSSISPETRWADPAAGRRTGDAPGDLAESEEQPLGVSFSVALIFTGFATIILSLAILLIVYK